MDKNFVGAPKTTKSMKILGYTVVSVQGEYVATYTTLNLLLARTHKLGISLLAIAMLIFYLLCYALVLKFLIYYAQYYAHVKELCLKLTV